MLTVETTSKLMMNRREAATYLGVQPQTLAVWSCRCTGPAFCKVGRSVRYRQSDLDAFISQSRVCTRDQK